MNAPAAAYTVGSVQAGLRTRLAPLGPGAALEARALLEHVLGLRAADLIAHPQRAVPATDVVTLHALADRRLAGQPLAYLTGRRGFFGLELHVTPAVLVPRPDTETLVHAALARLAGVAAPVVADLGTGSGAIACALAHARADARVLATDRSAAALAVARANARRLGLAVGFVRAHWLRAIAPGVFDLIVSNPPYVAATDPHLHGDGVRCEPRTALVAGADGLDDLRAVVAAAPAALRAGGWLLLEHGAAQGPAVRALLDQAGLCGVSTLRDAGGQERVSQAQRRPARADDGPAEVAPRRVAAPMTQDPGGPGHD